jgi:hypothetical protein
MSVIRVGSNSKYADGWSNIFASTKASSGKTAKKATKKVAKKKAAAGKKKR